MATQAGGDAAQEVPKYAIGTKVRKFFDGSGWFTGKVVSHDGTYYYVVYDDGDEEEYNDQELAEIILTPELEQVTIGSRVAVYRSSDDQYYEATVARERIDRKPLYLKFDNGDSQWVNLREKQFILLKQLARRRIRLQSPKNKSTNKEAVSEAPPSNDLAGIAIGSRIAVYRPSTDQYHEATVTQEQDGDNRFYCEYTGGAGEWLNLNQRDFIALEGQTNINDILPDTKEAKHEKSRAKSSPPKQEEDVPEVTPKKEESSSARREKRKAPSAASASNEMVSEEKSPKANKRRRIETSKEISKASGKTKGRLKSCNGSFNTPKHKGSSGIQSAGAAKPKGKSNHGVGTKAKGKTEKDVRAIAKGVQKYAIGTRVKKFFRGSGWFYGEVVSFNGWYYRILYSDGDKEDCNEQDLDDIVLSPELEKAEVGVRVAVHWPSDDKFYEATIVRERLTSKKPYYLEYDTGHYEWLDLGKVKFCILGGGTRRRSNTLVEDDVHDSDVYVDGESDSDA